MDGTIRIDERTWRARVQKLEFAIRDARSALHIANEKIAEFAALPSVDEAVKQINLLTEQVSTLTGEVSALTDENANLKAQVKELTNKVGGLKMTLGRYQKEKKERG